MATRRTLAAFAALLAANAVATPAGAQEDHCLAAPQPAVTAEPHRLRFGITPQLAGTVGAGQGRVVREDPRARDAALADLVPRRRTLVIRLNRLFMSGGDREIEKYARRTRRYARRGFEVESQIRYHPAPAEAGDMRAWRRFVRRATRSLAESPALVALSITNEVNLPLSENTSDGSFPRALDAITTGIPAAARTLRRIGRNDVELGFTYAYRWLPWEDVGFWRGIGERATPRFAHALDYVGVQLYPGLFWPPVLLTESAADATVEALTLVRRCFMPKAGIGAETDLWISEIGYATNLGHTEARQAEELRETASAVHALSGTLGITDFRYFNLRDNRRWGLDLFDNVGLLRPDYTRKPAFSVFRDAIRSYGRFDRRGSRGIHLASRAREEGPSQTQGEPTR